MPDDDTRDTLAPSSTPAVGVCEDDPAIRKILKRALRSENYEPIVAFNGGEALRMFPGRRLDVIIMDIGLPDADGRDVIHALKSAGQHAPVLFLTAFGAVDDRLSGFAAGAEDYVSKPFAVMEVLARVAVLSRRGRNQPLPEYHVGLRLDPLTHAAESSTGSVLLTPTEFRILAAIISRPSEVIRRHAVVAAGCPMARMDSTGRKAAVAMPILRTSLGAQGRRHARASRPCTQQGLSLTTSSCRRRPSCCEVCSRPARLLVMWVDGLGRPRLPSGR